MNQAKLKYNLPIIKEDSKQRPKEKTSLYNLIIRKVIIFLMEISARLGVRGKEAGMQSLIGSSYRSQPQGDFVNIGNAVSL